MIGCGAEDPYVVGGGGRRPVEKVGELDVVELGQTDESADRDVGLCLLYEGQERAGDAGGAG